MSFLPNGRRARVLTGLVGVAVIATAVLVAVNVTDSGAGASSQASATKAAARKADKRRLENALKGMPPLRHPHGSPPGTLGSRVRGSFPAEIIDDPDPFFSEEVMYPITNGWHTSNHRKLTSVIAGRETYHKDIGALAIYRENYIRNTRKVNIVKVAGAGTVTITKAPKGRGRVQTWAQSRGKIQFTSQNGITGALDLEDDSIAVNP